MEAKQRKILLIVILLVAGTTLAVAGQQGWFTFLYDPMGLDIADTYMEAPFELKDLPLWFSSDVTIVGSGYSGQEHNVSLSIFHDRPENGAPWYADGDYSLDLKLAGSVVESIISGSFTDLTTWNPYTISILWTPVSDPENYTIALNITNVFWSEVTTYPINATSGEGGTITPSGIVWVPEFENQGFTISPLAGYEISDVLVDDVSVGAVDIYAFINVQANHTIEASFTLIPTTFETSLLEDDIIRFNDMGVLLNSSALPMEYTPGSIASMNWTVEFFNVPPSETCYKITYEVLARKTGDADIVLVSSKEISGFAITLGETYNILDSFTAPAFGSYEIVLHITAYSNIP